MGFCLREIQDREESNGERKVAKCIERYSNTLDLEKVAGLQPRFRYHSYPGYSLRHNRRVHGQFGRKIRGMGFRPGQLGEVYGNVCMKFSLDQQIDTVELVKCPGERCKFRMMTGF